MASGRNGPSNGCFHIANIPADHQGGLGASAEAARVPLPGGCAKDDKHLSPTTTVKCVRSSLATARRGP
jgi:hypothetical protein